MVERAFIFLVVTLMPWVAVFLAWKVSIKWGAAVFSVSMAASFVFGYLLHFVLNSPDLYSNVSGEHSVIFLHTALYLALVEFAGFAGGLYVFCRPKLTNAALLRMSAQRNT